MFNIVYHDSDFLLVVEWDEGVPILHHHFYNWSVSVYKKAVKEYNALIKNLQTQGHKELWSHYDKTNTRVEKFCERYNFVKVAETDNTNIVLKEI